MRNFSFRIWDNQEKNFLYEWQDNSLVVDHGFDPSESISYRFGSPQQDTELLDASGRSIFEGDIIGDLDDEEYKSEVFYRDGSFCVQFGRSQIRLNQSYINECGFKIIGNAYEGQNKSAK
jgi:hypothetical protein